MNVNIYSRKSIELIIAGNKFPDNTVVISFYDPAIKRIAVLSVGIFYIVDKFGKRLYVVYGCYRHHIINIRLFEILGYCKNIKK